MCKKRIKGKMIVLVAFSVALLLLLSACGEKVIEMNTSSVTMNKVTNTGVIEYHGGYYIVDKYGINYKDRIDRTDMTILAHTSKENGEIQRNFAICDDYIYFISEYKDASKMLYRSTIDGKKRTKIYVRDDISIVGCYGTKVYFTDEQKILKTIDSKTKEKDELSQVSGSGFVQCNNCIFFTSNDESLKVYNCDDKEVFDVSEGQTIGYSTTSKGLVYAVNSLTEQENYNYKFSNFTYHEGIIENKADVQSAIKYTAFTETLAFANDKKALKICNINSGEESEYSYNKQGNLIVNSGLDYNVYYLNDNTCMKFAPDSEQPQQLKVDFEKNKIDFTQVIAIVGDKTAITLENGYYKIKSLA